MKKSTKWILIAAVAALVAAATTLVILALRARAKKRDWYEEEAAFDCDLDDEDFFIDEPIEEDAPIEE